MSKPKPNWPLGLSLHDLDADRAAKPAKSAAAVKKAGSPKPGITGAGTPAAADATDQPPARRGLAAARWFTKPPAIVPEL